MALFVKGNAMIFFSIPLGIFVTTCAIADLRNQKIPNIITFPTAIIAVVFHSFSNGLAGLYWSTGGWALGIFLLIIPYILKAMGAGDVKLLAAVGAFVGPIAVIKIFIYTAITGSAYALLHLLILRIRSGYSGELFQIVKHLILFRKILAIKSESGKNGAPLCYGIAIAIGTYVYVGETHGIYRILGA